MENPLSSAASDTTDEHNWSTDIEQQLQNIEQNSVQQSIISKREFLVLISVQKYFKIPVIILSGLNSIFAVGLNAYLAQNTVSVLNCILAFSCATLGSIELYLQITKKMDVAFQTYQDFYLLSIKINNCLRLDRDHRAELDGRAFLSECLTAYEQLFQTSNVSAEVYDDKLINLQISLK